MTTALWAGFGGMLGALARCLFVRGIDAQLWPPRLGREAGGHLAIGFFTGGLLGMLGPFVPADWLETNVMTGASKVVALLREPAPAAFLAALLVYCGLDLTRVVRKRLPDGAKGANGTDTTSPGTKLGAVLLVVALGAAGCAAPGPPTIVFEARGFLSAYRTQRDEALIQMAPAILRCRKPVTSLDVRAKCEALDAARAQWYAYDLAVFEAMLAGRPVPSVDLEKAGEWALKVAKFAADILL
jgi:hypothetical protein